VGPSSLTDVGRMLGPLLAARCTANGAPINLIAFENHRRAQELFTLGAIEAAPAVAARIGRRIGISGGAVWRTVSRREVTEQGLRFTADRVEECLVDAVSLIDGAPPADGSIPGLTRVRAFDDRMVEKLWLFNAGHATAAYLAWQRGCTTMAEALADPAVRSMTVAVMREAQQALDTYLAGRPGSAEIPHRSLDAILEHYADPALGDTVTRVAREPRRKLAADDRLIGPAVACLAAGIRPTALATAAAAALAYREPGDRQAVDLQRELELVGPEEVLAGVSTLDPRDELVRLICERYHEFVRAGVPA
jgi:mannitol-1-phosphate 5-dehydrogenase